MALKYNNNEVKVVKFNNNDVNKVIKDGTVVWLRQYTITWKNYDGSVLKTDSVSYETTPSYSGDTPTKPADANYNYTFKEWSPSISTVTGDKTYTATYSSSTRTYTVTVSKASYMYGIYLSTSPTTAPGRGSASGSAFNVGTTVYAIAMFTGSQWSAISSKPKTWGSVNYNGTYYYCSVGSTTVVQGANTITYSAPTLKQKLPAPSANIKISGSNYVAEIHNNTNVTTTVTVTWYNASTNASLGSATVMPGSHGNSTTTLAISKADSVYVKAYATASGYPPSDTTKSKVCIGKLRAPQIMSTDIKSESYKTEYRTNVWYEYSKYIVATIKNPNNVRVTVVINSPDIEDAIHRGSPSSLAAGATGKVTFSANPGGQLAVKFNPNDASVGGGSDWTYITCPYDSSGGQT